MFLNPGSRGRILGKKSRGLVMPGNLISVNYYTSTQTLTVPFGATKAFVRLQAGGGGAKTTGAGGAQGAAGAGAYLEKYLTGLVSGLTLALTVGAGGTTTPSAGGNTTLASGTQLISTLTTNGGALANSASTGSQVNASGGTATGGDLNTTGQSGFAFLVSGGCVSFSGNSLIAAQSVLGMSFGAGALAPSSSSAAGQPGIAIIMWFS